MTRMLNKTENGKYLIHTRKLIDRFPNPDDEFETIVFPAKRDGSADIDKSITTIRYKSEDEAYAGHLEIWKQYSND